MKNKIKVQLRALLYPIIATMNLHLFTFIYTSFFSSCEDANNEKIWLHNQTSLQGLFIFGCFMGTEIVSGSNNKSSKFFFILSDLLIFLGLVISYYESPSILFSSLGLGINYTQSIIYLKQFCYKSKREYFFFLIPFHQVLGHYWSQTRFEIKLLCVNFQMILLLIFDIETPSYFFFVKKDLRRAKRCIAEIHNNTEIQKIIFQSYQELSIQERTKVNLKNQFNNLLQCSLLVLITYVSGFNILMLRNLNTIYYPPSIYQQHFWLFLTIFAFSGCFCFKYVNKFILIILGQVCICIGLGLFILDFENSLQFRWIGHYMGLGSFIYLIIAVLLPESDIFSCIKLQWIIQLVEATLIGILSNTSGIFFEDEFGIYVYEDFIVIVYYVCKLYFYLSCLSLVILFVLLRDGKKKQIQENQEEEILINQT